MFSGSSNMAWLLGILSDVWVCRKSKMGPITVSINDITCISASVHVSNKVPTAIPMFWVGLRRYTPRLLRRPPNVCICWELKIPFVNRRLLGASALNPKFLTTPHHRSSRFCSSLVLLHDPENMSIQPLENRCYRVNKLR